MAHRVKECVGRFCIALSSLALIAGSFPSKSVFADSFYPFEDVNPISKLGKVVITAPTLRLANIQDYTLTLLPKLGGSLVNLELDKEYLLEEQEICLNVQSRRGIKGGRPFSDHFCGYKVVRGQTLHVELAGFKLKSADTYTVDVGPILGIRIAVKPQSSSAEAGISIAMPWLEVLPFSAIYIAPLGQVRIDYSTVGMKEIPDRTFELLAQESQQFDITPPDLREKLIVDVMDRAKFPIPSDGRRTGAADLAWVSFRSLTSEGRMHYQRDAVAAIPRIESSFLEEGIKYFQSLNLSAQGQTVLRVFPQTSARIFTLDINGYSTPLDLGVAKKLNSIDVFDFDRDSKAGVFKISRFSDDGARIYPLKGYSVAGGSYYNPMDIGLPTTRSSIVVPRGYQYRVETYVQDDVGRVTPQSVHDVDFRKQ